MKLQQGLLKQKRLESEISTLKDRINKWNVVNKVKDDPTVSIAPRPFDVIDDMGVLSNKIEALIKLKVDIRQAYSDIQQTLIKKEETEKYLVFLQGLNMTESYYGQCDKAIDELKQLALIESVLDELDDLSLEISKFELEKEL